MKDKVYITRDFKMDGIEVWPERVGIRKFCQGQTFYGAAWAEDDPTSFLYNRKTSKTTAEYLSPAKCRKRFGFIPRKGTAHYFDGKKVMPESKWDFIFEFSN
ncbi:hypothetical protein LCGC14_2037570 [marine sediment metagenome]|uniref:Uncharacterized protein n=1 Tax=marine sediment metagenome TaxID=412755 RepID=A0A0F9FFG5_9ZZZZ